MDEQKHLVGDGSKTTISVSIEDGMVKVEMEFVEDGFGVSFSVRPEGAQEFAEALKRSARSADTSHTGLTWGEN